MLDNATGMITALWDCICVVTKHGTLHSILFLATRASSPPAVAQCSLLGSGLLPQLDVGPFIVIYRRLFILLTANCLYRQFS